MCLRNTDAPTDIHIDAPEFYSQDIKIFLNLSSQNNPQIYFWQRNHWYCPYLLSLCSRDVAWFGHRLTVSCTCSGFMKIGMALMTRPGGGWRVVLNRTGHVVAIRTYNFFRLSEYCKMYRWILRNTYYTFWSICVCLILSMTIFNYNS